MRQFNAGRLLSQGTYKSFSPSFINREWMIDDMEILNLLSKADLMLGRLDMYSQHIPNLDLFIRMHITKEATQSSKIEGTQTNIEDAIKSEEDVPLDKRDDWAEVQNYINAMNYAIESLSKLPLSSRLIRNIHEVLMKGVRGEHKYPGEFRTSQNWIGGSSISDAVYVPPVYTEIPDLMSDIENFIHNPVCELPDLIKIALIHYQFETIHPFLDGNGRTGRLLITLYLVNCGVIKYPVLYLSDYLENHRNTYYRNITMVRETNSVKEWLKFFLTGIYETAKSGVDTFSKILDIEEENQNIVKTMGKRSANALKVITELYKNPLTDVQRIIGITGLSIVSAYSLISDMVEKGVLQQVNSDSRKKLYILRKYFDLFN